MRMLCVVSAEHDWVRGWKGRAAGLDSIPPKTYFGWGEMFLKSLCQTACQGHTVRMLNVLQGEGEHGTVWLAWTVAMSEPCSRTTEWSFQFNLQESNRGVVCMYVHSHWCSSVGVIKENINVLSILGYLCSTSKTCPLWHGSDGVIWSLETLY